MKFNAISRSLLECIREFTARINNRSKYAPMLTKTSIEPVKITYRTLGMHDGNHTFHRALLNETCTK